MNRVLAVRSGLLPFKLDTPDRTVFINLEATRQTHGTRQQIMVVEIKCFPNRANTTVNMETETIVQWME